MRKSRTVVGAVAVTGAAFYISRRRTRHTAQTRHLVTPQVGTPFVPISRRRAFMTFHLAALYDIAHINSWGSVIPDWIDFTLGFAVDLLASIIPGISTLYNLAEKVWGYIIRGIGALADAVVDTFQGFAEELWAGFESFKAFAIDAIHYAREQVEQLAGPVWDTLRNIFAELGRLGGEIYNLGSSVILPLIHSILDPLISAIHDLIDPLLGTLDHLWETIDSTVRSIVAEAIREALDLFDWAGDLCARIVSIGLEFALDVPNPLEVLRKIWHILAEMAELVGDVTTGNVEGLLSGGIEGTKRIVDAVIADDAGDVERYVTHLFGLN